MRRLTLKMYIRRAQYILKTRGLWRLMYRLLPVHIEWYYVYVVNPEEALADRNEIDYLPKIRDFSLKTLCTLTQADDLARQGFNIPAVDRDRLAKGQTALCVFAKQELVHVMFASMTEEAKKIEGPLVPVDFSRHEACGGWTWTNPRYRGTGVCTYVGIKRLQSLRDHGILRFWSWTGRNNLPAQRTLEKLGHRRFAEARYIRFLWCWRLWQQKPLACPSERD